MHFENGVSDLDFFDQCIQGGPGKGLVYNM